VKSSFVEICTKAENVKYKKKLYAVYLKLYKRQR